MAEGVASELRHQALEIFRHALDISQVRPAMERCVRFDDVGMIVDGHRYVLGEYGRVVVIAIGKAAGTMTAALLRQAGSTGSRFKGIVAGWFEEGELPLGFRGYRGGHPSPNEASVAGAVDVLATLRSLTADDLAIFLISGGGSSMMELFLNEASLETMASTHKALVECGAPIASMNAVRKHLSAVKGGRLAEAAAPAEQMTLLVSDVPSGQLDALASGPTMPDESSVADVARIVAEYGLDIEIDALMETPKVGDAIYARSRWSVLLDSSSLEEAAKSRAEDFGWRVVIDNRCDDWSAEDAAWYLVGRARELRREGGKICLLSAGEVTVRVPQETAGRGGRNQHFCLLCSEWIAGGEMVVLSGGSDGIDGNSPAAGAVVDGSTVARALKAGYPVADALAQFDAYGLLERLGDAVTIGATGNNLRDLRILLVP
jgi:glycerate 2-kinase